MFADPLVLAGGTWGRTAAQLITDEGSRPNYVCTGRGLTNSTYRYVFDDSHYIDVFIGHQLGKRRRYTVRLTENELVPDLINTELNAVKSTTAYLVVDRSVLGAGTSEVQMFAALAGMLITPSDQDAQVLRVLNGET